MIMTQNPRVFSLTIDVSPSSETMPAVDYILPELCLHPRSIMSGSFQVCLSHPNPACQEEVAAALAGSPGVGQERDAEFP